MAGSYAYLSLVLNENETATATNNIIPFNTSVNTSDIYLGYVSDTNLYGYITLSTPGYYMVQYMVQIGNTNNFAMVPIVGSNGNLPTSGITGADFSAYQSNQNLSGTSTSYNPSGTINQKLAYTQSALATKSNQILGSTIYYFDTNATLSLYQLFPTSPIIFNGINEGSTLAYILVYLLPLNNSWACFNNLSSVNPTQVLTVHNPIGDNQGNYNSIGSGISLPTSSTSTTLIPFNNFNTSTLNGDDFFYSNGIITYIGTQALFLNMFMANLVGYGLSNNNNYYDEPGTYVFDSNISYDDLPIYSSNFGISFNLNSTNNNNLFISGVMNPTLFLETTTDYRVGPYTYDNYTYPTYQNFQYLSSEVVTLNENDSFSFNFLYYGNFTALQNQMYTNQSIPGINARSFMFPVTNPYIYLTNFSSSLNNTVSNNSTFSFSSYTNNETFNYDPTTNNISLSQPSNVIVYFSITVQNSQVPFISLNSNVYSNNYYQYNNNTYPVTGMAIFQNVSNVNLTNVSGYDISLALPYNDTITVLNAALFIMTI